ncbi:hypothetical protein GUITHDRAFT_106333 [Guillardia theta CCMP2712]|uniref:Biopterin transport-related protein BT1 n=1 Tax=Guillardia theta (strain CCMP2712) TaxID=905079 RepID=L1JI26_GUITC|nr:hypothetical protein GUITHDRAFT_106333 [Guillardia theta CCMP2712]EKX47779.1 hypothetical protein GUITHDRAFT_106333 [Guillardia theta CCMP2712]|eukprot:XP_005834759.1 hypothetical protein GUITHDRAFT_106333 [Guillardia theta CCMP2712]
MGWSTSAPLLVFLSAPAAAFLPSPPLRSSFPLRGDCSTFSSAAAACGAPASFLTCRPALPCSRSRRDRRSGQTLRCQVQQQEERQQKPPISFSESGRVQFFGVEATAEVWAIAIVYFVQGILGISRLAVSFYYKDSLHLGPAELALVSSIQVASPSDCSSSHASDGFPLFGYKRRSYLILSGLLGSVSWASLSLLAGCASANSCGLLGSVPAAASVALVTLSSLGLAFSDVLVDALVVTRSRGADQSTAGSLQSLCWSSSALGSLLSAYASGQLVQSFGPAWVFSLTALFPLITSGVAGLIDEKPAEEEEVIDVTPQSSFFSHLKSQGSLLWGAFSKRSILLPVTFLVLWQSTPTSGSALFFFETNELGFTPEFLGRLSLVSSLSSLLGIIIYDQKLKRVPLRVLFKSAASQSAAARVTSARWICLIAVVLGMSPLLLVTHANRLLGLPDQLFAIGDDVILTVLGQIAFMPVLVLGANICPPGVEASLYAALMSVNNLSGSLGSGLLPLPFLNLLPKQVAKEDGDLVIEASEEEAEEAK